MSWSEDWRRIRAVALKDLTSERRSRAGLNAVTFLGVLVLMLFGFALGPDTEAMREAAAGALWLAILFAGVLAFNRSYQLELDGGALEPLLLYPGSRWSIFAGKLLANLAFVALVEVIVIPVALVLFHVDGLGYQEIAARLDVPLGTVATWVTRARRALAEALEDDVLGNSPGTRKGRST